MNSDKVSVYAVGDVVPDWPNPESLVELALPTLKEADIRFGQLEAPLSEKGEPQMYMHPFKGKKISHIKAGRLRVLAVTSAQPSALFPGLPTVAASGVPGFGIVGMMGFLAPSKTPTRIINQLNHEMVRYLNTAAAKMIFTKTGLETVGNSPEEFASTIKSNMSIIGKLITDVGIKGD